MGAKERKFTMQRMADYLNNKYKCKTSGEPFNRQDTSGYISRGRLPREYGGNRIEFDQNSFDFYGIKLYKLLQD